MMEPMGAGTVGSQGRSVAVVFHEPRLGGASSSVLQVVPLLEEHGWRFSFWVPGHGTARARLEDLGRDVSGTARPIRYSRRALSEPPGALSRLASTPAYLREFRSWLDSRAPDVVHANTLITIPELLCVRRHGPARLLHVHEMLRGGLRDKVAGRLLRHAAEVVVACSTPCADGLRRGGVEPLVVHNGVPLPVRGNAAPAAGRLRVGTAGTVSKRKGSDLFLAAAERVAAEISGAEFRIAGDLAPGPESAWAHRLVATAHSVGVRHVGHVKMVDELAGLDVFVLPAREDPFPIAVLEAMSMRLPVVGTRVDGIAEQLSDGAGILVPPDDVEGLAQAIILLARDPELRSELGETARRRVEQVFTLERQADGMHGAYLEALRRRRAISA
jgi:glycosyltransferase involved in cell wall biosynthesis